MQILTFFWCNRCCCCHWRCQNFQAAQCSMWLQPRNRNMWRHPPEEEEPPPAPCCLVHTHRLRNKNLHPFLLRCRPQAGTRDTNKKVRLYPKKQHLRPLMEFLPFPMHIAKCRSGDNLLFFRGPHHTFDAWLFCPPARISSSFYSVFCIPSPSRWLRTSTWGQGSQIIEMNKNVSTTLPLTSDFHQIVNYPLFVTTTRLPWTTFEGEKYFYIYF